MKNRIRYLSLLVALLCGITVWADDDFDPTSPSEPGQIQETFKLTLVADPAEAASTPTGGGRYLPGTSVTLKTTANSGWRFVNWTDENGATVTSPYTTKAVKETLTAHFEYVPDSPSEPGQISQNVLYGLSLAAEEGGTVSGGGRYKIGTQNTVTATAKDEYDFVGWYDSDGETLLTTNSSYKVTMVEGGLTLLAKFSYNPPDPNEPAEIKEPHKVKLTAGEGGTVSATTYRLKEGETTTIRANANSGYDWDGWYQNGVLYTESEQFTYTMGSASVEFEARFIFNPDSPKEPSTPQAKHYTYYLMNIIGKPGDTVEFPVHFTSQEMAKDMSFQMTFPTELVPDFNSVALAAEAAGYEINVSEGTGAEEGESAYMFTLTGGEMAVSNIVLLTFNITIPETLETGKGYPIYINQITVNDSEDAPQAASARHGRVSVYKKGDTNGDDVVNASDVLNIVKVSLNRPTEVFIQEVSDFNNNEQIDASDVLGVVKIALNKN